VTSSTVAGRKWTLARGWVAALASLGSWLFAFVLGSVSWVSLGGQTAFTPLVAVAAGVTVALVAALGRSEGTDARLASWVLFAWVPYLFFGAVFELREPIVSGHFRCGNGVMGLFFLALVSMPVVFALFGVCASLADRSRLFLATRTAAWALSAVAVLVLAAAGARSNKLDAERWADSLPEVARLDSAQDRFVGPFFIIEERVQPDNSSTNNAPLTPTCRLVEPASGRVGQEIASSCAGVRVLHDEVHDLWVLHMSPGSDSMGHNTIALDGQLLPLEAAPAIDPADVDAARIASSLRPPLVWTATLAAGTLVALFCLVFARRLRTRASAWRSARNAMHRGDGWVTFEDASPPVHLAGAAPLASGPILVLESKTSPAGYRQHGRSDDSLRVAPGSLDALIETAEVRASNFYGAASLAVALTLAPMFAAALYGLLG
jgi:hypothetical protein